MLRKIFFNWYIVIIMLAVLVFSAAVKIDAQLSFPEDKGWNYQHLQEIDRDCKEFSFAIFGDNKNSSSTFNALIDMVNQDDVLFAFDDGDLVFDGEREKFAWFLDQAYRFQVPLLTAIGNHELRESGRANYYDLFGPFYYSFTVGDSYFIVLDDADEQGLDPFQMEWLRGELDKSQAYIYRFVIMHVPLYDPRTSGFALAHCLKDPVAAQELNDLFDQAGITMVFASHIHGFISGTWGKTPFIITGGAGAELYAGNEGEDLYHYVKFKVTTGGVDYEVVPLPTPSSNILARLAHVVWLYIYAYVSVNFWNIVIGLVLLYLVLFLFFHWRRAKRGEGPPGPAAGSGPGSGEAETADSANV
jgi:Calcineurin-like phosphoesterase